MTLVDPQPRVLPPGVDAAAFQAAIASFRDAIGGEHVHVGDEQVRAYDDRFPVTEGEDFTPSAVLFPGSTEDVQAIVRIANEHLIPLHSFLTGMNLGYGGSAPRVRGTVLLHLGKRMDRVLEINERLAYAVVEPGVDYKSLYEAVEASGAQRMIDPTELDWGSPLGNIMEHGAGYTPYGDHAMWRCGMEVVLPDGSVMRTGQGALPGSKAWHIYAGTLGPSVEGLFEQSNFGICTRMGIQLMPKPPEALSFVISFDRPEDLAAIMDTTLPLRIGMAPLQNPPIVRNVTFDAAC
ncbi:FAD-binding oxidoreductase, partial [Burkholderia cenocepacia]|uniref:FAD-binding oxidoreductase n=1 Tax=Burkholderia cenocepacia TaxID=95486 RepID=UPI0038CC1954